ncbi:MAG: 4Fe-4S binding protein [Deltaproteobacteria bacterium]|uniref:4Fe-4S binding protein n=1 Tax=Candidatus Zymogenus saltonus TaxID=2844893 RepID=A0A9D8KEJ9_9DELT|nr:4Fe-4S binding protein [Candidatus Zymogenus saltonus]
MKTEYFKGLSRAQLYWAAAGLLVVTVLVVLGILFGRGGEAPGAEELAITADMTIGEIAPKLDVTGKSMAKELGLPLDAPKNVPVGELGVTEETLNKMVNHLVGHRESNVKYYLYGAVVLWGWLFLVKLGRPKNAPLKKRKIWYPRIFYVVTMVFSAVFLGFLLEKSPNPMEGGVKLFKTMVGLYPDTMVRIAAFLFFVALAVVGNKIVCGWACPFGSLQELIYSLPLFKKLKKKSVPFIVTNTIRGVLFVVMLLLLFGIVGGKKGYVLYHALNPFNLFNFDFELPSILITTVAALVIGAVMYRPYCRIICPFGLISWFAEYVSLYRVRIDKEACTKRGACITVCPSGTAKARVYGKKVVPDCFSCARCLNVCPEGALDYGCALLKPKAGGKKKAA